MNLIKIVAYSIGGMLEDLSRTKEEENEQFITEVNDLLYKEYNLANNEPYIRTTHILGLELIRSE